MKSKKCREKKITVIVNYKYYAWFTRVFIIKVIVLFLSIEHFFSTKNTLWWDSFFNHTIL